MGKYFTNHYAGTRGDVSSRRSARRTLTDNREWKTAALPSPPCLRIETDEGWNAIPKEPNYSEIPKRISLTKKCMELIAPASPLARKPKAAIKTSHLEAGIPLHVHP
ncbi:hypothetical protein R1flu_025243 [Riccia fluitans]|uniref:Uncharacterized protein n=1 Tax=Riccia fluitans TaxID=41844 RepID=A0ABD1XX73_9MARC